MKRLKLGRPALLVGIGAVSVLGLVGCECDPPFSPPACRAVGDGGLLPCPDGQIRVCQARRCAPVVGQGAACSDDPCSDGAVCDTRLVCRGGVCEPGPTITSECDPGRGTEACAWPFVCSGWFESVGEDFCPNRPANTPDDVDFACTIGRQSGQSCDADIGDPGPACLRCEPGLECVQGICAQSCETDADCPCDSPCTGGFCFTPCTPGEACLVVPDECGTCASSTHPAGDICVRVGAVVEDGMCVLERESPDACEPVSCESEEVSICQRRRCAQVAFEMGAACSTDPCGTDGTPTICAHPLTCRATEGCEQGPDCPGECRPRTFDTDAPITQRAGCSARSRNNIPGNSCPFPFVCRGYEDDFSSAPGSGCPPRDPDDERFLSECVPGQTRGQVCDASFLDLRPSCLRCEPGLECVNGTCQMPCEVDGDCPCLEQCNGGWCGTFCFPGSGRCTAARGVCGTCQDDATCSPTPPVVEGCGPVDEDDDCDGRIDEEAPDRTCDGVDDDCDGEVDEDWRPRLEYTLACDGTCSDALDATPPCDSDCLGTDLPGRAECRGEEGVFAVCRAGRDFCIEPGEFPASDDPDGPVPPDPTRAYWCGGDIGDVCENALGEPTRPCRLPYVCDSTTDRCIAPGGPVSFDCSTAFGLCDPDELALCLFCHPSRDFPPNDCTWDPLP